MGAAFAGRAGIRRLGWLGIGFAALGGAAGAGAQPSAEALAEGKRVYDYWCLSCHGVGLGLPGFGALPGTQQLALKYRGTAIPPGRSYDLARQYQRMAPVEMEVFLSLDSAREWLGIR